MNIFFATDGTQMEHGFLPKNKNEVQIGADDCR
jgi:hypothetical protein